MNTIKDLTDKFKDVKDVYKCDECGATFCINDVEVQPYPDNFSIFAVPPFEIAGKASTLHCPKCHKVHLRGFDKVEEPVL